MTASAGGLVRAGRVGRSRASGAGVWLAARGPPVAAAWLLSPLASAASSRLLAGAVIAISSAPFARSRPRSGRPATPLAVRRAARRNCGGASPVLLRSRTPARKRAFPFAPLYPKIEGEPCLVFSRRLLPHFSSLASPLPAAAAATTGLVRGTVTVGRQAGRRRERHPRRRRLALPDDDRRQGRLRLRPSAVRLVSHRGHAQRAHELQVLVTVSSDAVATVDIPLSTQLVQIAQTTVTAHAGLQANPPSVNQLSRSTIQTSPVQNSLDKLISTLPGVIPFSYNEPVINGFHGVTYNIDGAPLPLATTSNFAEIVDPKNINSFELLTGAIPAEYGGDRMGGVVNIITNRPTDLPEGFYGTVDGGFGNLSQASAASKRPPASARASCSSTPTRRARVRGLDAPTFDPIHDNASQSDQFLRFITQLSPRSTLGFDYSNQLAQFQIPINTDPNNPYDPIFTPAGNRRRSARVRPLLEPQLHADVARRQRRLSDHSVVALDPDQLRRRPPERRARPHAQPSAAV